MEDLGGGDGYLLDIEPGSPSKAQQGRSGSTRDPSGKRGRASAEGVVGRADGQGKERGALEGPGALLHASQALGGVQAGLMQPGLDDWSLLKEPLQPGPPQAARRCSPMLPRPTRAPLISSAGAVQGWELFPCCTNKNL
jgi:hypothetical protein